MSDNRYGNLLDRYLDGSKKYTSPVAPLSA